MSLDTTRQAQEVEAPKNTWRRMVEGEMKTSHHAWSTIQNLAKNRQLNSEQEWRTFVAALHASGHYRQWVSKCVNGLLQAGYYYTGFHTSIQVEWFEKKEFN